MHCKSIVVLSVAACMGVVAALLVPSPANAERAPSQNAEAARAGDRFLASLSPELRKKAWLPLDSPERLNWNFVPMSRAGVWLLDLDDTQAELVGPLLASGLSPEGLLSARGVIKHENVLRRIESEGGRDATRRDPGHYYTAVFGTPKATAPWAWRFEGHHLSVNVTHLPGQPPIVAPLFMGANPARVPSGPQEGFRLLANEEDYARELITLLPSERRARALIADRAFSDILTGNDPKVEKLELAGIAAADMNDAERRQLRRLIDVYLDRLHLDSALETKRRMDRAGFEKIHFAWAGGTAVGQPHYYRVHGPTLLIEYDNTQNDANHIHSVYRDLERDFGGDALRGHLRAHHHETGAHLRASTPPHPGPNHRMHLSRR
jgi:hypothetical protein